MDEMSHATAYEATTRFIRAEGLAIPTIQEGRGQYTLNKVAFLGSRFWLAWMSLCIYNQLPRGTNWRCVSEDDGPAMAEKRFDTHKEEKVEFIFAG